MFMTHNDLINHGLIWRGFPSERIEPLERTIIVTGLGRSGTSMIAAMLAQIGILSIETAYPITLDDKEFLHLLKFRNSGDFRVVIAARNRLNRLWAFKLPSLHGYLTPEELQAFRNPHLIVVFRDLVAVTKRHAISEITDPLAYFFEVVTGMSDLVGFLRMIDYPMLLVSYEKAISFPEQFADALARVCGMTLDDTQREQLCAMVRPNNADYVQGARRQYEGNIDGLFNDCLVGWCREIGEPNPVRLDLAVDGIVRVTFLANQPRDDIRRAGIGHGVHGFAQSMQGLGVGPESVLSVRVSGRTFDVPGSGKCAREYCR